MCDSIDLPELIDWNDYLEYDSYEDALLDVYNDDLWNSGLTFNGKPVVPRVHKRFEWRGKKLDWTFAHFTSKGPIEEDRIFDLRRCERIAWVKILIENAHQECIKVFENSRPDKKGKQVKSVVLWCECANSKIVLSKRKNKNGEYYVITTFYLINSPHKIKRQNKEYEDYVLSNGEYTVSVPV